MDTASADYLTALSKETRIPKVVCRSVRSTAAAKIFAGRYLVSPMPKAISSMVFLKFKSYSKKVF